MTSAIDEQRYVVIPLSVQKEGDEYLIGNLELNEFYQFPEQGLRIIDLLRLGNTATTIKSAFTGELVDVDDFLAQLASIGFIYPEGSERQFEDRLQALPKDNRVTFKASPALAKVLFSAPALAVYCAIIGYALFRAIQDPSLRLNPKAFYFDHGLTLPLVLLLVMYFVTVTMHELGHMLAAARYGIDSKLGIGHRLWNIVAEADLTGILTLPKSRRYLPLFAGMMVDVLNIALFTILISATRLHISGFAIQLLQGLILQIAITISWQFNIFLRTDMYYALCTYFSYPDLDQDARKYLRDLLYKASSARFGESHDSSTYHNIAILRWFALTWVVGRVLALAVLIGVYIPTLARYAVHAYRLFRAPGASISSAVDVTMFVLISFTLFVGGMYMWLRRR